VLKCARNGGFTNLRKQEQETFLSPLEAARALKHSRAYVYELIATGSLPAKREDGRWLVAKSDVEKRREQRRPSTQTE
jgi:excisionase family DNA binding protein